MTPSPYFQDEWSTIYCGDSLAIAPLLTGIDAVVSDPPYGINHLHSSGGKGRHFKRNLVRVAGDSQPFDPSPWLNYPSVILWGANHFADRLPHGRWLVWDKLNGLESFDTFSDVEIAWQNTRAADRIFRWMWKGICRAEGGTEKRDHPSQKPVPLMVWCLSFVPKATLILDPYMGVGSTLVAAKLRGIKAVGIELEERYCKIAVERLRQGVLIPC